MNCWRAIPLALSMSLVAGTSAVPSAAQQPSARPNAAQAARLQFEAEELLGRGKFAEAAALLQQATQLNPDDWALWDQAGWALLSAGKAEDALKAFEASRKAAPADTPTFGGLVVAHYALGHEKEVLDAIRTALSPEAAQKAEPAVKKGLAARPRTPDWAYGLGYLYVRVAGNHRRAIEPLLSVVKAQPKYADAWLLLVEANQALNRGPEEDEAAIRYLELQPDTADAYRLRADRYAVSNQNEEAAKEYEEGIGKHPLAEALYSSLARLYERTGATDKAEATFLKLAEKAGEAKQPALVEQARLQAASFHARQRRYPEAEKYYQEAAKRPGAAAGTVEAWAWMLALQGKWAEAAAALELAASRETDAPGSDARDTTRYRAALCRLAAGQKPDARKLLESVLSSAGAGRTLSRIEALAFLAWLEGKEARKSELAYVRGDERWAGFSWRRKREAGEFDAAARPSPSALAWRSILLEVQKKHPDCWPVEYLLARSLALAAAPDEAVTRLGLVVQRRPDWWAPHFALGQHYAALQERDKAAAAFTRVVQLAPDCGPAKTYLSLLRGQPSSGAK